MGNITPTSDVRAFVNGTSFQIGDTVQSTVDSRIGVILMSNNLIPTRVPPPPPTPFFLGPKPAVPIPPGVIKLLPLTASPIPLGTGGTPPTPYVQVQWVDGTISTVLLSTLGRV